MLNTLLRRAAPYALAPAAALLLIAAAPAPTAQTVTIGNFTFGPQALTVKAGTTVTWINGDDVPHTIVAVDKSFRSKVLDTDERFAFTFVKPGAYAYFCSIHPHMTGKIVVTP
ncbi:MAG TPA: cupredoxin family copper-binding protein [Phenylobacterium sp.]|jgi:plastocyanin|nr:cupredoxin family copper-binding protein [Phenylobacterium sp.]